jgi:hypothetical protein
VDGPATGRVACRGPLSGRPRHLCRKRLDAHCAIVERPFASCNESGTKRYFARMRGCCGGINQYSSDFPRTGDVVGDAPPSGGHGQLPTRIFASPAVRVTRNLNAGPLAFSPFGGWGRVAVRAGPGQTVRRAARNAAAPRTFAPARATAGPGETAPTASDAAIASRPSTARPKRRRFCTGERGARPRHLQPTTLSSAARSSRVASGPIPACFCHRSMASLVLRRNPT